MANFFERRGMKFYRGNKGEKDVRKVLAELPETYIVFADVEIGHNKGNIDFVVLAPSGVFILEVKSYAGEIDFDGFALTINGRRFSDNNFFREVHGEIWALKQYLQQSMPSPYIHAAIVFSSPNASMNFGYNQIENIYIIQKDFLPGLFTRLPLYHYQVPISLVEASLKRTVHL